MTRSLRHDNIAMLVAVGAIIGTCDEEFAHHLFEHHK
jgi:hypothetical protein